MISKSIGDEIIQIGTSSKIWNRITIETHYYAYTCVPGAVVEQYKTEREVILVG